MEDRQFMITYICDLRTKFLMCVSTKTAVDSGISSVVKMLLVHASLFGPFLER